MINGPKGLYRYKHIIREIALTANSKRPDFLLLYIEK